MMKILNNQIVGKPLTLECGATVVRGITSKVDIVWSSNGVEIKRIEGINLSSVANNSKLVQFTDIYTILKLSTSDEDRSFQCNILIGSGLPVNVTDSIILNVTG